MTHTTTGLAQPSPPGRPATLVRTVLLTGLALAGSTAMTLYLYGRMPETFSGVLQARSIPVTAPFDGVIDLVSVKPGQIVYAEESLFVIRSSEHAGQVETAQAEVRSLESKLKTAEAECQLELHQILADMDSAIHVIQDDLAQLEGERFQLQFRDTAFSDFLGVLDSPVASSDSSDLMRLLSDAPGPAMQLGVMIERGRIENDLDTKRARISLSESRLSRLKTGQELLPEKVRAAMGIPAMEERLGTAIEQLSELEYADDTQTVNSPIYGMAGLIGVKTLDEVQQGETLLQVFDRSHERIHVELPGRLAPGLKVDREVSLTFPGGEVRAGRIESIPPQVTRPATPGGESQMTVTIRSAGRVWPTLPIGTTVSVSLAAK